MQHQSSCKILSKTKEYYANITPHMQDNCNENNKPKQHHIRSFVQRARRLTPKKQQILTKLSSRYLLHVNNGRIDFNSIFPHSAPIILEIGFGMGDSLWQMIKTQPAKNFIGIEVHSPGVSTLIEKLATEPHDNIKIYHDDAIVVLKQCIPDKSLQQILLFFPDPWPKRRQHKRRIVQLEFIELISQKLIPNGTFHMLTDCQDYARHSQKIIQQTQPQTTFKEKNSSLYTTKFSQRALQAGEKIYEISFTQPCL